MQNDERLSFLHRLLYNVRRSAGKRRRLGDVMMIIETLMTAIFQLFLFTLIPFIWWLIFWRKKEKFLPWIGLKKPIIENKQLVILLGCSFLAISLLTNVFFEVVETSETAVGQFQGMGATALISGLIFGMITTGLSEEILFRGFLAKRLIKQFGFAFGNIFQALLFGIIHVVLFHVFVSIDLFQASILFALPFLTSFFFGYINEKKSDGSIIPSYLIHGIGNVIASVITMFNLN